MYIKQWAHREEELTGLSMSDQVPSEREKPRSSSHAALSLSVDVHLRSGLFLNGLRESIVSTVLVSDDTVTLEN